MEWADSGDTVDQRIYRVHLVIHDQYLHGLFPPFLFCLYYEGNDYENSTPKGCTFLTTYHTKMTCILTSALQCSIMEEEGAIAHEI